jgi:hypothetical protein
LRFAGVVIMLEGQTKFPNPNRNDQAIKFLKQRIGELEALGLDRQQLIRVFKR